MARSANLNVMMKTARRAGRALLKDFAEVEQLQVSTKGPGDFVTRADRTASRLYCNIRLESSRSVRQIKGLWSPVTATKSNVRMT